VIAARVACGDDGRSKLTRQFTDHTLEKGAREVHIVLNFLVGELNPHVGTSTKPVRRAPAQAYVHIRAHSRPLTWQFA
jgi:hypothetical protein